MAANPDEHIPDSEETRRLAIVDLDWDKIRAVDILAVLRSFLGKGQSIQAVTVYPSDFGLEKMKEEAAIGPQVSTACALAVDHVHSKLPPHIGGSCKQSRCRYRASDEWQHGIVIQTQVISCLGVAPACLCMSVRAQPVHQDVGVTGGGG